MSATYSIFLIYSGLAFCSFFSISILIRMRIPCLSIFVFFAFRLFEVIGGSYFVFRYSCLPVSSITGRWRLSPPTCHIASHGFDIVSQGFAIVSQGFNIVSQGFDIVSQGFDIVSQGLDICLAGF